MIWLFLIGCISGIISGMGIGGGVVLIPALGFLFDFDQKSAQHINLIYFIPTAIVALITHVKNGNVEKKLTFKIAFWGLLGAVGGSLLALQMNPDILRKFFGAFLLIMGIVEFLKKDVKKDGDK